MVATIGGIGNDRPANACTRLEQTWTDGAVLSAQTCAGDLTAPTSSSNYKL